MLILLASYQKILSKKKYLSDMKYDVKTSEMIFLLIMLIMSRKCMSKGIKKTYFHICKQKCILKS